MLISVNHLVRCRISFNSFAGQEKETRQVIKNDEKDFYR